MQERRTYNNGRMISIPPLPCYVCDRLTEQAEILPDGAGWQMWPRCWEHGFTEECGEHEALESIKRFVVGYYGGVGMVETVTPCDPFTVPGYVPRPRDWYEFDDVAWKVCYIGRDLQPTIMYVVFHMNYLEFEIYPGKVEE